jgi:hypothetical protein
MASGQTANEKNYQASDRQGRALCRHMSVGGKSSVFTIIIHDPRIESRCNKGKFIERLTGLAVAAQTRERCTPED